MTPDLIGEIALLIALLILTVKAIINRNDD